MKVQNLFSGLHSLLRQDDNPEHVPPDWPQRDRMPESGSDRRNAEESRSTLQGHQAVMPRKILVVEDDPFYVDVVREAATDSTITVAVTWQSAMGRLNNELYDLVI